MLSQIKLLLDITDNEQDSLISLLIDMAKKEAVSFCNLSEYTALLDNIIISMVVEKYNKRGS